MCHCSIKLNKSIPKEDKKKLFQLRLELYDLSGLFYTLRLFKKIEEAKKSGSNTQEFDNIIDEIGEETCNRYIFKDIKQNKIKQI